jgi:hypothetical protein
LGFLIFSSLLGCCWCSLYYGWIFQLLPVLWAQKWNLTMVINTWQKPLLILGHSWSQWDILIGQYNTFCCQRCLNMHTTPAVVQTTPVSSFRLCFLFVFKLVSFFSWLLYWLLLFCQIQKIQYLTWLISQFLSGQLNHMSIEEFSILIMWSLWTVLIIGKSWVLKEAITVPLEFFVDSGSHVNVAFSFLSPCEIHGIALLCWLNLPKIDDIHCLLCLVSLSYYPVIYCLFQKLCRLDHGLLLLHWWECT